LLKKGGVTRLLSDLKV
jgi:P-type Ca2+ transporter type 2C